MKRVARLVGDLALWLLAIGAAVVAFRFGVMTLLESLLPAAESLLTAVRRVGVVAAAVAAYWAVARAYERRAATELRARPLAVPAAAALGVVMIGVTIALLFLAGRYEPVSSRALAAALPILGFILPAAIVEELVFRGVVFRLLERDAGTLLALVVQAVAFGALHLFNEGTTAMTVVSVTLLGAFWALLFVLSRNVWVVAAHHFAWNATIFAAGVPLSGQEAWRASAPLETRDLGPAWLTGGAFGPEDSVITVVLLAGAVVGLASLARRRGVFAGRPGAASEPRSDESSPHQ